MLSWFLVSTMNLLRCSRVEAGIKGQRVSSEQAGFLVEYPGVDVAGACASSLVVAAKGAADTLGCTDSISGAASNGAAFLLQTHGLSSLEALLLRQTTSFV